uniref:Uncharacterized protein n=1 Tax=Ditylenchus dipsaci TaxID=166011 RepID=A0A915D2W9_9BILA
MESGEETEGSYAVLCDSRADELAQPQSRPIPQHFSQHQSFGRGLSKSLKRSVRGSYKKYDGEKAVHEYSDVTKV